MKSVQLPFENEDGDVELNEKLGLVERRKTRSFKSIYLPLLIIGVFSLSLFSFQRFQSLEKSLNTQSGEFPKGAKETFEIQLPILYENLVHEQHLLDYSFGNSWGIPAKTSFKPEIEPSKFNRVVLTLNTTVDGVQYDRLAHVFIDDFPVWRTSTAEPGKDLIFSSSSKDVSKYLSLFQKDEVDLTFQLDNLVRGRLNGAFNTTLSLKYYFEDDEILDEGPSAYFQVSNKPAQKVTKLYKPYPKKTPLLYYPSDKLEFTVPVIEQNTTSLKLELYISGNAAEEFWYSNVLDKYKDKFINHGHSLLGRGPVRVVNIYLDDVKITSLAPEPVIFSGGISPALWKPIIGVNAFDIKALEIDLTAYLPNLWKTGGKLKIEVTNGEKDDGKVAQNWIAAANLLHWESAEIESSFGEVETFDNKTSYKFFAIETSPDNLFQTVVSNHTAEIYSNLTFNLYNGSQIPVKLHTISGAGFANFQTYAKYGDYQFLSAVNTNNYQTKIYYQDELLTQLDRTKVFPVVISILTEPVVGYDITYEANITHVYQSNIKIDDELVYKVKSVQNGTSVFTLSPNGNSGFGSTDQKFSAKLTAPYPELKIKEVAKAINGSVVERSHLESVSDHEDVGEITVDVLEFQPIVKELNKLVSNGDLSYEIAFDLVLKMFSQHQLLQTMDRPIRSAEETYDGPALPNICARIGSRIKPY